LPATADLGEVEIAGLTTEIVATTAATTAVETATMITDGTIAARVVPESVAQMQIEEVEVATLIVTTEAVALATVQNGMRETQALVAEEVEIVENEGKTTE
jgi:hypothetical protein